MKEKYWSSSYNLQDGKWLSLFYVWHNQTIWSRHCNTNIMGSYIRNHWAIYLVQKYIKGTCNLYYSIWHESGEKMKESDCLPLSITSLVSSLKELFNRGYLVSAIERDFIKNGRKVCLTSWSVFSFWKAALSFTSASQFISSR